MKTFWKISVTIACAAMLGGCDPAQLSPATRDSLCAIAYKPIYYNTYNPKSGRYSGPILALDIKQRNQIGQRLGCPAFATRLGKAPPAPHVSGYGGGE